MRYRLDSTWSRVSARVLLAGSPLKLFRLTEPGGRVLDELADGRDVTRSSLVDRLVDANAIHPLPRSSTRFTADDVTIVTPQLGGAISHDGRITVDDGSNPPLAGATVRLDTNAGPGAARNAGRRRVSTALIAFVDADVDLIAAPTDERLANGVVSSQWLDELIGHFDDDRVGLVAPRVSGEPRSSLDLGDEPARIRAGSRVSYVPAAAVVVRASAFDSVGGFDELLRFGEDVDFVWRLDQAGWACRYEPSASVHHRPRARWVERLRRQVGYGSSAAPLALRHPTALAPLRTNGWNAATWSTLAFGHPLLAVGIGALGALRLTSHLAGISTTHTLRMVADGHVAGVGQVAAAVRRAWWPLALVASTASRRARWITVAALLAGGRSTPNDLAYGWGVWSGMRRRSTWRPIVPQISAWPGVRHPATP